MSNRALGLSLAFALVSLSTHPRSPLTSEIRAEVVFSDSLGYQDGPLTESSAEVWRHHSGAESELQVVSGSVTLAQSNSEDVHARLGLIPFEMNSDATLYAGFELTPRACPSGNPGYFFHFKDGRNGFRGRLFLAATDDEIAGSTGVEACRLGISNGDAAPNAILTDSIPLGETVTVIVAYDLNSGNTRLWLRPDSEESPNVVASDDRPPITVHAIALRQAGRIGQIEVDNIRVATDFESVLQPATGHPFVVSLLAPEKVETGQSAALSVVATGETPFTFQWLFNGDNIEGATSPTWTLNDFDATDAGDYSVLIRNSFGETESAPARIELESSGSNNQPTLALSAAAEILDSQRPASFGEIDPANLDLSEFPVRPGERIVLAAEGFGGGAEATLATTVEPAELWVVEPAAPGEAVARFDWSPTLADAESTLNVSLEISDGLETAKRDWTIYVPSPIEQALVITEVLPAPSADPDAAHFNPLNRSEPVHSDRIGVADEFVELVNHGSQPLDIGGWTLGDAAAIRHRFPAETILSPNGAMVVHGADIPGSEPNLPGDVQVQAASISSFIGLGLNNGGDVVRVRNTDGRVITQFIYQPGEPWSGTLTRQSAPIIGDWTYHPLLNGVTASPGRRPDGEPFSQLIQAIGPTLRSIRVAGSPAEIRLLWAADTTKVYSVFRSASVAGVFEEVSGDMRFADGAGAWQTTIDPAGTGFYYMIVER